MKSQSKIIMFLLGILLTLIFTIYLRDVTFALPLALIIGVLCICSVIIMFLFTDFLRLRTDQIITNLGHYSIRKKDIFGVSWSDSTTDRNMPALLGEKLCVIATGSIDSLGVSLGGSVDSPVIICPSIYLQSVGRNYRCHAHLQIVAFRQLPLGIQDAVITQTVHGDLKHRISIQHTPFLYGNLCEHDGSFTPENSALERDMMLNNEELSFHEEQVHRLYGVKGIGDDQKNISIVTGFKKKTDEEE